MAQSPGIVSDNLARQLSAALSKLNARYEADPD
jgi:hypothetical protein